MAYSLHDELAQRSIELYSSLPRHGKPRIRDNGVPEWTILATISLARQGEITPISLGAGVKVLPASRLPPLGDTVHDCHAEILARRGFVRWLIEEARMVLRNEGTSGILLPTESGRLRWNEAVKIWLYVSALPCGDSSTLHTAAHQSSEMAALKSSSGGQIPIMQAAQAIRGRNGYESFGAIRTKPGRADSDPTICMSCSDKIASWNVLGLQGGLLADLLEEPIYLDGIVIGGVEMEPPSSVKAGDAGLWWDEIRVEAERSLVGRLEGIANRLKGPYRLSHPAIKLTDVPFPLSKPEVTLRHPEGPEALPNVQCILHIPSLAITEVLHNGCKSGGSWKPPGEVLIPPKARSLVCKYELLRAYQGINTTLDAYQTYFTIKHKVDSAYQRAKSILRGEVGAPRLLAGFDICGNLSVTGAQDAAGNRPPFAGWIVSGQRWESFTIAGQLKIETVAENAY